MSLEALRTHPWLPRVIAAAAVSLVMIGLGQLAGMAGGQCTILCKPTIAGIFGAVLGFVATAPERHG